MARKISQSRGDYMSKPHSLLCPIPIIRAGRKKNHHHRRSCIRLLPLFSRMGYLSMGEGPKVYGGFLMFFVIAILGLAIAILVLLTRIPTTQSSASSSSNSSGSLHLNATCDPPAPYDACTKGYTSADGDGEVFCETRSMPAGTACVSSCYPADTAASCTADHVCQVDDQDDCPGACTVDSGNADFPIVQYDAPSCDGGVPAYAFFTKAIPDISSSNMGQWAFFNSNEEGVVEGDCMNQGGCTYYAMVLDASLELDGDEYVLHFTQPGGLTPCASLLNMTKEEASVCLVINERHVANDLSNAYWRDLFLTYNAPYEDIAIMNFSSTLCSIQWACAASYPIEFQNGFFLWPGDKKRKRTLLDELDAEDGLDAEGREKAAIRYHLDRFATKMKKSPVAKKGLRHFVNTQMPALKERARKRREAGPTGPAAA